MYLKNENINYNLILNDQFLLDERYDYENFVFN